MPAGFNTRNLPQDAPTKRPQVVVVTDQESRLRDFLQYLAMDHDVVMAKSRRSVLADADLGAHPGNDDIFEDPFIRHDVAQELIDLLLGVRAALVG